MISKAEQVLNREGLDEQRARRFLMTLPNAEMVIKYRKNRKQIDDWTSNGEAPGVLKKIVLKGEFDNQL